MERERTFPKKGEGRFKVKMKEESARVNRRVQKQDAKRARRNLKDRKRKEKKKREQVTNEVEKFKMGIIQEALKGRQSKQKEKKEESDDDDVGGLSNYAQQSFASGRYGLGASDSEPDELPDQDMYSEGEQEGEVDVKRMKNEKVQSEEEEEDDDDDKEDRLPSILHKPSPYNEGMVEEDEESEEEDGEEEDDDDEQQDDVAKFREKMAHLPLSKVREMKEKLGIKLFNAAFFGTKEENTTNEGKERKKQKVFKRENSKRPREISSKKAAPKLRNIYKDVAVKKKGFDPRYDERCGEFKEEVYDQNFAFLSDLRQYEKTMIKKEALKAKKEGDFARSERLREEVRRMENREKSKKEQQMRKETISELKKQNIERMKQGLAPIYAKRSEVRMRTMEKKFNELKKEKKLDKFIKRRAKKEGKRKGGDQPALGI